ncbi:MAG: ABC transporter permease subunit [Sterolibacteriaceae bacterium]|nr:ABC transporter permease subunit [Candidatus Methylophosphatis haderslevensis]
MGGLGRALRLRGYAAVYAVVVAACCVSLYLAGDLSFGRKPWQNLVKTAQELARPSLLDLWYGDPQLEYRSDDGRLLRVENQRESEARFLRGLGAAIWTTFRIATLGSLIAALAAFPLGLASARNLNFPRPLALAAKLILDVARSIHSLVFGLLLVGILGLGATAGILAIAAHSLGSYGKLYAESIESIERETFESGIALGAGPVYTLLFGIWRGVLPRLISSHLYIWEYNIRDSTVLGLIGAGGLGLLVSEAVSLFQWGRLSTILIAIVALVIGFDALSRRIRNDLMA